MAVIVTCRSGHVTHRSEVDADGRCETCARIDHAVADERERCAKIAAGEEYHGRYRTWPWWKPQADGTRGNRDIQDPIVIHAMDIAAAIRGEL